MNCPHCGKEIQSKALFCPFCGRKLETEPLAEQTWPQDSAPPDEMASSVPSPKKGCRTALFVAGGTLAVILVVGLVFGAAVYFGLRDRQRIQTQSAQQHYQQGEAYMAEGRYELAIAEFELALQLNPNFIEAKDRLATAKSLLETQPTPTSILQQQTTEAYWEEIQSALEKQDWPTVVERAEQLIALDPTYRREELDTILCDAFYYMGIQAAQEGRLEEAITLFDRALEIKPDNPKVGLAKSMAKLYMDGIRYAGVDWPSAIDRLAMLYNLDPNYMDVRPRLHEAYMAYGDQLAAQNEWCLAAEQYRRAHEIMPEETSQTRLAEATAHCGTSAPTTEEATAGGTPSPTGTTVPAGTFVGKLVKTEPVAMATIYVRGHVLDRNGQGVPNVRVKIQAWDWFAYAISDGQGQFSFDGLGNPVTYTLSLPDLPSIPVEAPTAQGQITWVLFEEAH